MKNRGHMGSLPNTPIKIDNVPVVSLNMMENRKKNVLNEWKIEPNNITNIEINRKLKNSNNNTRTNMKKAIRDLHNIKEIKGKM